MDTALITVFTPTYNRIKLLPKCYDSLRRQTCHSFIWLIIDDGSDDGTSELVRQWTQDDNAFEIRYIQKTNGGLHTAYNCAIEAIDTELTICVDSDDYLTDTAIEDICHYWSKNGSNDYAGIVALNRTPDKEILGHRLPDMTSAHIIDLYCKYNCRMDLKMIYRTALLKSEGPIPTYGTEKNMNPYYLFLKIDKLLPMLLMNTPVCIVNYQNDGMSSDIFRQYMESPRSFAALRQMMISMERATTPYLIKNSIHLVSSVLISGEWVILTTLPQKWITAAAFLPGLLWFMVIKIYYLRYKYRTINNKKRI